MKKIQHLSVAVVGVLLLTGCSARVEAPEPETHQQVDQFSSWAADRSEPYEIPERALRAYAFAAWKVREDSGCEVGWPTIAALGTVLSDHGQAQGTTLNEDGTTTTELRGLGTALKPNEMVEDTDGGQIDGTTNRDVPVGPFQIMPSRWEQYATSTEADQPANPDDIDDAALTTAIIVCQGGDLTTPDGWDRGITAIVDDPETVKEIHAVAKEYSR
ncbi:hypothetical protein [Corynebacterium cystitidis]|uniref:hypothetical protein n=1 Tax=Corynebacterium cystitidis TaxID=35757 RepID=UPI00211DAC5A|nr:hypothetical protein [Corynebacterium cystitidis]